MLKKFLSYITEKQLFNLETERVLLAVSGGMDSVVMSHLFYKAKINFAIAHINFGLRGEESDADEVFVKKLAKKYKVPFFFEIFETEAFAKQEKVSIQMAARILRYQWLDKLRLTEGFAYIATAHHLNDTLETVFFNITKGTGISGLHGIQPKNKHLIRPLLFADKEEIYSYIVDNQLAWREDSSNQSGKYQRNLIRNEVVPLLKTINPNLENTIAQTIERVTAVERIFEGEVVRLKAQVYREHQGTCFLNYERLREETEPLIKLHALLKDFHYSYNQVRDIWQVLDGEPGKRFESPTHLLVKDRSELVITPKLLQAYISESLEADQKEFQNGVFHLKTEVLAAADFKIPSSNTIASLDLDTLQFPLKIRKWKEGDWFCPLGMNKKKKLSDFMIDEKIPLNLKDRVWVVTSNGSIVWVIGHRIDNRFKLTDKTTQIYKLSIV
jgi:tRNA(Ile)-lysidine synthase